MADITLGTLRDYWKKVSDWVDGTGTPNVDVTSIAAGDNNIGNVDIASIAAGTNVIGKVSIDQTTNGTTNKVVAAISGAVTTPTHTEVTVGNTSTSVLASNTDRLYAMFINDSNEDMYMYLGAAASLNKGIRIKAAGGAYEMSNAIGNLYTGAIYAICASGSKVMLVTEGE